MLWSFCGEQLACRGHSVGQNIAVLFCSFQIFTLKFTTNHVWKIISSHTCILLWQAGNIRLYSINFMPISLCDQSCIWALMLHFQRLNLGFIFSHITVIAFMLTFYLNDFSCGSKHSTFQRFTLNMRYPWHIAW